VHGHGGHGLFDNSEAYVCGPAAMVRQAALMLSAQLPPGQIHHDPLPAEQSLLAARPVTADPDDFPPVAAAGQVRPPRHLPDAPA